jgi:hypothetical protein
MHLCASAMKLPNEPTFLNRRFQYLRFESRRGSTVTDRRCRFLRNEAMRSARGQNSGISEIRVIRGSHENFQTNPIWRFLYKGAAGFPFRLR